jgi:predicted DCC family thiol-disulfide oxidoreductase YuxK
MPAVPLIVLIDGECALCNGTACLAPPVAMRRGG